MKLPEKPNSQRQFRRKEWGSVSSTSPVIAMARYENERWLYETRAKNNTRRSEPLARENIDGEDYYECNIAGKRIVKQEQTLIDEIKINRRKAHLHSINVDLKNGPLPDQLDAEAWEKILLSGKRVEASYVKDNSWNEARENDASFSHRPGDVKYRLIKEK